MAPAPQEVVDAGDVLKVAGQGDAADLASGSAVALEIEGAEGEPGVEHVVERVTEFRLRLKSGLLGRGSLDNAQRDAIAALDRLPPTTMSPLPARLAIQSSATSSPAPTTTSWKSASGGSAIGLFATT